jgi:putative ABC transport system permease protein
MRISTIAFANLKRRKGKALFLIIGIAIGIGTAVAVLSLSGSIKEEIGAQLDQFGANIVVLPQSNSLSLNYGGVAVSSVSIDEQQLKNEDAIDLLDIPYRNRLSIVAPKLLRTVEVEGKTVVIAGVDFDSELKLKRWWHIVGSRPAGPQDLLLGYEVASALSVIEMTASSPTPPVSTPSVSHSSHENGSHDPSEDALQFRIARERLQIAGGEHRVAGVLRQTGGPEDHMIFGELAHVQQLVGRSNQLSLIEVAALCKDCPVEDIVAQISERLPHAKVSAIQQSVRARADTVERLTRFFAIVAVLVLSIGALMIFTTMMGSVIERTREIGVLRAIGFRKAHIIKGLIIEVAVISVIGGLVGWAAGTAASWLALPYFAETEIAFELQPLLAIAAITAGLLIGILSSFYPIIRASRLDPSEAVRYV